MLVSLLLLAFILYIAVDKDMNSYGIYIGKYICVSEGVDDSWIQLEHNGDVNYSRGMKMSYVPCGEDRIKGNRYTLHTAEGDVIFKIHRDHNLELIEDPLFEDYEGKMFIFQYRKYP